MIINDIFHKLEVNLTTSITNKTSLVLDVYIDDSTTAHSPSYTATSTTDGVKFIVPFSDFSVGDEITDIKVSLSGTNNFYDLAENVTILLDGKTYKDVDSSTFEFNINDTEPHTLQAVYKGNKEIGSAYSELLNVKAEQKVTQSASDVSGDYKITITAPKKMKYLEQPNWTFKLTRGTNPVPNKTLEKVTPNSIRSDDTDSNGETFIKDISTTTLRNWNVGTYTIGANFWRYENNVKDGILTKAFQTLTIEKATPTLKVTKKPTKKKDTLVVKLTDPLGVAIQNAKMTYTINGKSKTKKTNQYGNISIAFNNKGTFTYEVKSPSLANYKSVKVKGKVTISQ